MIWFMNISLQLIMNTMMERRWMMMIVIINDFFNIELFHTFIYLVQYGQIVRQC